MIRAAVAVLPAVALLAACSSAAPSSRHEASSRSASNARADAAARGGATPTPLSTAGASRASSSSAGAASPTPVPAGHTGHVAPAAASAPTTLHPPAPGTYVYTTTNNGSSQNVDVAVSPMQDSTDTLTWHSSNGAQSGQLDATLSWPGSGAFVTQVMFQGGTVSYTCALSPPVEMAPSPIAVGGSWSSDSTCSVAGGTLHWTEQDHVSGSDTVQVGGVAVLTYLIAASRTLTYTGATTSFTSSASASDWFAPSLGLEVRDESRTTTTSGGTTKNSTSTLQLDSTQPQ